MVSASDRIFGDISRLKKSLSNNIFLKLFLIVFLFWEKATLTICSKLSLSMTLGLTLFFLINLINAEVILGCGENASGGISNKSSVSK